MHFATVQDDYVKNKIKKSKPYYMKLKRKNSEYFERTKKVLYRENKRELSE